MSGLLLCPPLYELDPIGLDELNERAELQTRVDRKYLLPTGELAALLTEAGPDARVLKIGDARSFAYQSVYFDTPELITYQLTAHRRRRRFKIRTRTYLDSGMCWLEVKTCGRRESTVKHRLPYDPAHRATLTPGRRYVDAVLTEIRMPCRPDTMFTPTLVTEYRRSTLLLPAADSRVTIDTDLSWFALGCYNPHRRQLVLPHLAVIETKTGSTPSHIDRILWARGYRPARISKYATGLAALRPDLPANRWHRTLLQHFVPADTAQGHHPGPRTRQRGPDVPTHRRWRIAS
jgi:hypothetical protein